MSLAPLLEASMWVQLHVAAAILAIVLGAYQFLSRKGSIPHRIVGWIWVVLLAALCITSFFIPGSWHIGPVSVFHLLSVYTLWSLYRGVQAARDGEVADHKNYMTWLFTLSVVLSALIAVAGGGVLYQVAFPAPEEWEGRM